MQMHKSYECTFESLEPEIRKALTTLIPKDEKIRYCSRTDWFMLSIQILTDKQVVIAHAHYHRGTMSIAKPSIDFPNYSSIPFSEIRKIDTVKDNDYDIYNVKILGSGNTSLIAHFITEMDAKKFSQDLRRALDIPHPELKSNSSPIERMKQLNELYKNKLITDKEYNRKRREILDEL